MGPQTDRRRRGTEAAGGALQVSSRRAGGERTGECRKEPLSPAPEDNVVVGGEGKPAGRDTDSRLTSIHTCHQRRLYPEVREEGLEMAPPLGNS